VSWKKEINTRTVCNQAVFALEIEFMRLNLVRINLWELGIIKKLGEFFDFK